MPESAGQLIMHTDGGRRTAEQLLDEDTLRGRVELTPAPIREGDLGGVAEIATNLLSGGVTVTVVARCLTTWRPHPRSDRDIHIARGRASMKINGERVDADTVLRCLVDLIDPDTAHR
ncbi:effector-associated constant component EACC1 [Nocardia takedensis]